MFITNVLTGRGPTRLPYSATCSYAKCSLSRHTYSSKAVHFTSLQSYLRLLDDRLQRKSVKLESELRKEGKKHAERIQELQRSQQTAFSSFQELEKRISDVAARVVHLGEQLEGVNTPREHAFDAQKLMGYFSEFLEGEPVSDVLVNPSMLNETADIIRKLYLIAQELPGKYSQQSSTIWRYNFFTVMSQ